MRRASRPRLEVPGATAALVPPLAEEIAGFIAEGKVVGLLLGFGALILRLQGMAFGEPSPGDKRSTASTLPIAAHLGIVLLAGLYLPPPLVVWFQHVAAMLR